MTFSPDFLLVNPDAPEDLDAVQLVTHVVCHEILHMWCGSAQRLCLRVIAELAVQVRQYGHVPLV